MFTVLYCMQCASIIIILCLLSNCLILLINYFNVYHNDTTVILQYIMLKVQDSEPVLCTKGYILYVTYQYYYIF